MPSRITNQHNHLILGKMGDVPKSMKSEHFAKKIIFLFKVLGTNKDKDIATIGFDNSEQQFQKDIRLSALKKALHTSDDIVTGTLVKENLLSMKGGLCLKFEMITSTEFNKIEQSLSKEDIFAVLSMNGLILDIL